jgi:mono/diheme cytochrome c family protein
MNARATVIVLIAVLAAIPMVATAVSGQSQSQAQGPWPISGMGRWPMGEGVMWPANSSMPRHHLVMMWGVPAPYTALTNPLPRTKATVDRGAQVYAQNCVSCHGVTGQGDGEAGRKLSPPPGNLAWLSQLPLVHQDAFMYWTVAEGGSPLGSGMPTFKATLSKDDIWSVIAYIQARLPTQPNRP